jgi:hypothetical protein
MKTLVRETHALMSSLDDEACLHVGQAADALEDCCMAIGHRLEVSDHIAAMAILLTVFQRLEDAHGISISLD